MNSINQSTFFHVPFHVPRFNDTGGMSRSHTCRVTSIKREKVEPLCCRGLASEVSLKLVCTAFVVACALMLFVFANGTT